MRPPTCIFCSIISGDAPASRIFEDDLILGILALHPRHRGHTLLLPKRHVEDVSLLDAQCRHRLFDRAAELKPILSSAVSSEGFNLLLAEGPAAGSPDAPIGEAPPNPHLHLHLIPRSMGVPIDINWQAPEASRKKFDMRAAEISSQVLAEADLLHGSQLSISKNNSDLVGCRSTSGAGS